MLPAVLAITHTLTMYYIFSGLAVKGLKSGNRALFRDASVSVDCGQGHTCHDCDNM